MTPEESARDRRLRAIAGGRVVTPDGVVEATVQLDEDGRVAGVGGGAGCGPDVLDARGAYVLPGLIDLHCDAIERQVLPRPGGELDAAGALVELDLQAATNGIVALVHAVALIDGSADGLRRAVALARAVAEPAVPLRVRHRLHVRCELTQPGAADAALPLLRGPRPAAIVSLMDHSPGRGQFPRAPDYLRYLRHRGLDDAAAEANLARAEPLDGAATRARAAALADAARAAGAVLALHDDDGTLEALGGERASVSEFPLTLDAARAARERGRAVLVGAPNVVRGRSASGNLDATAAVRAGVVDGLCSDYHPPSLLRAVFALARDGVCSLERAVALASDGPARVLGSVARIEPGAPADLLVVGLEARLPRVRHVLVGGRAIASLA